jgi:hypothetical protein
MRRIAAPSVLLLALLLALPFVAAAQQYSGLTGNVTDGTGARVPDVAVKLENSLTNAKYETKTNDLGVYIFVKVAPGSGYKLTFSKQNFRGVVLDNLSLGVAVTETRDVQLQVGTVTEAVEVKASPGATLNTTDASVGNVISGSTLNALPSLIRENPLALLALQPGVSFNPLGATSNNINGAVTGSRTDQGNVTIDGIDANDQAGNFAFATVGNAPIESVQEFRTVTAVPDALDGRSSGAQVAIVTKSGTNHFHGSAYEYNRTSATAANDFFNNKAGVARPALTRNQFGSSLGGPIIKDKLFFFFNYEGRRDARGSAQSRTVPLDQVRNGGVAYIHTGNDANGHPCSSTARLNDPVTGQCVTVLTSAQVAAIDPKGIGADSALMSLITGRYPHANDLTGGDGVNTGLFRFNAPVGVDHNTYVSRVDYKITPNQSLFARWNIVRENDTQTVQQFPGDPTPGLFRDKTYSYAIGHTWTINANNVNSITAGVTHQNNQFPVVFTPSFPNSIAFGPYSGAFPGLSSQGRIIPTYTFRDDYSMVHGRHTMQFGVDFRPIHHNSTLVNSFNFLSLGIGGQTASLGGATVGGNPNPLRPANILNTTTNQNEWDSVFAFELGRFANQSTNFNYTPNQAPLAPGSVKTRDFRFDEFESYWQDTWRVRSDFTMTYGVRWSYYTPPYEVNGFETTPSVGLDNLFSIRTQNGLNGFGGNTAAPFLQYNPAGKANGGPSYYQPSLGNFGPRFDIAWNPSFKSGLLNHIFGDRKTSVRLSASIVYDRISSFTFIADQASFLFDNNTSTNFGSANPTTALLNDPRFTSVTATPIVSVAPVITKPATPNVVNGVPNGEAGDQFNFAVDPNFKTPYEDVFSLGIQRELKANTILEVDYVGRLGRRLFTQADAGQIVDFKDPASGQMLISAFNNIVTAVRAGTVSSLSNQPFFENQVNAAIAANFGAGVTCQSKFGESCTQLVATGSTANSVNIGSLSRVVQSLNSSNLLFPNVGLFGQFSANDYVSSLGSSNYHGLLVSVRKRMSHGLQMDFNYTYSHAIDNQSSVVNTVSGGTLCDFRNLRVCRGSSDFDVRQVVSSNWVYSLPFGHGQYIGKELPGWANQILGGWQLTGIWSWRTGTPLSFSPGDTPISRTVAGDAVFNGNFNAIASGLHTTGTGSSAVLQFFTNPTTALAALSAPFGGADGQRNIFRGPHFWNVDMAALKNIKLPWGENHNLQFRAEAFNVFNHENFGNPNTSIFSSAFGQVTASANGAQPRQMQFALRYEF